MHSIQDANNPQVVLAVEHLNIQHEQQLLVDDLNFQLHAGETIAIVGESGSGKSISSLALLGLLPSTLSIKGQVWLGQQDVLTLKSEQLRQIRGQKMAMIFQEPMTALNPLHRVEKIIGETLLLQGWSKAKTQARIIELLNDVGMTDPEDKLRRYPHELSGGQRQRVMIAMALALDPDILIADEPTTALDVTLQAQILALLKSLQQSRKMAMILISHDLNLVHRYADQDVFDFFVYSDCDQRARLDWRDDGFEIISIDDIGPGHRNGRLLTWSDYNEFLDPDRHFGLRDEGKVVRMRIRTPMGRIVLLYYFYTEAVGTAKILRDTIGTPKCIGIVDNGIPVPFGGDSLLRQIYGRQDPRYLYVSVTAEAWPTYVPVSEREMQIQYANQFLIDGFGNCVLFESAQHANRIRNGVPR